MTGTWVSFAHIACDLVHLLFSLLVTQNLPTCRLASEGADEFEEDHETLLRASELSRVLKATTGKYSEWTPLSSSHETPLDSIWKAEASADGEADSAQAESLVDCVRALSTGIHNQNPLQQADISTDDLDMIASAAEGTDEMGCHCVDFTRQDVLDILQSARQ